MNAWSTTPFGRWDQGILTWALRGDLWNTPQIPILEEPPTTRDGIIAILAHKQPEGIREKLKEYPYVLSIHTSDESHEWDAHGLSPLWMGYATPKHSGDRNILIGWPEDTLKLMPERKPLSERKLDWVFSGQVNHQSRIEMVKVLDTMKQGEFYPALGFNRGIPREHHLLNLTEARVAPCPAGTVHPDSFRLYEALEAGCLPVVEQSWFWDQFNVPFPVVEDWENLPAIVGSVTQEQANKSKAWWLNYKRSFALNLLEDARFPFEFPVTTLISTSSSILHPSTELIEETIGSIRRSIPGEIILMIDGLADERFRDSYAEYVRRVIELCGKWGAVLPLIFDSHTHQATMTREALRLVRSPYIFFAEHDTPLLGEIPTNKILETLSLPDVNLVRLYHGANVPDEIQYMIGNVQDVNGLPMRKTYQWSQRPHFARTDFYKDVLNCFFDEDEKVFIEDRMEGICRRGGWTSWMGMWIYSPTDMQRSTHSDGRRGEPKAPQKEIRVYP